jgi:hypothetical protein
MYTKLSFRYNDKEVHSGMPLSTKEVIFLRHLLSRELSRMKRPDVSDLVTRANFAVEGRHLFVLLSEPSLEQLDSLLNTAALNCGLPIDYATVC